MELEAMQRSFERVEIKQTQWFSHHQDLIHTIASEIEAAKATIETNKYLVSPIDHRTVLTELNQKLQALDSLNCLEQSWQELKVYINEFGKLLKDTLIPDISKAYRDAQYDQEILTRIIINHFLQEGMFDVLNCFVEEVYEPVTVPSRAHFEALHCVRNALEAKNVEPALDWVSQNKDVLKNDLDMELKLCLKLHRVKFAEILQSSTTIEATEYAKAHFTSLCEYDWNQIKDLMVCLLFQGSLHESPCADVLDPIHFKKLGDELFKILCDHLKLSYKNHLNVAFTAGADALPTLLQLVDMVAGKGADWQKICDLPEALPLRDEFHFHSVVMCPICVEQCTDKKPPLKLVCGHIICERCLTEMENNKNENTEADTTDYFKCPCCRDSNSSLFQRLHL